jgi:hypothetical protein
MFRSCLLLLLFVGCCPAISLAVQPAVENTDTGRAMGRLGADWRYVYYHGRHWYWMPNQTWRVWTVAGWAAPESASISGVRHYTNYAPSDSGTFRTFVPMGSSFGAGGGGAGPAMANEHFLAR